LIDGAAYSGRRGGPEGVEGGARERGQLADALFVFGGEVGSPRRES
jgi:hypothetical protein